MAGWRLRRAEPEDAAALAACIDAAYEVYAARIPDLPAVSEGIAEDISRNVVWVATRAGRVGGGLVLIVKPDHLLVANVAVAPAAAGTGLGRALLDRATEEARTRGKAELRLSTHIDMPENVRLYEHLGWRVTGRAGTRVRMSRPANG